MVMAPCPHLEIIKWYAGCGPKTREWGCTASCIKHRALYGQTASLTDKPFPNLAAIQLNIVAICSILCKPSIKIKESWIPSDQRCMSKGKTFGTV